MKRLVLFLVMISSQNLLASTSNTLIPATFRYQPAMSGYCVDKSIHEPPAQTLSDFGMTQKDLPLSQQIILRNVLKHMVSLHGSELQSLKGTKVRYFSDLTKVYARQTLGPIDIGPRSLDNYAVFTHELGHVVGNSSEEGSGKRVYDLYNKAVSAPCHFSGYSKVSHGHGARNEEFAEVFAAYLLAPNLLLEAGPECRQAHDFMREKIFTAKDNRCD